MDLTVIRLKFPNKYNDLGVKSIRGKRGKSRKGLRRQRPRKTYLRSFKVG